MRSHYLSLFILLVVGVCGTVRTKADSQEVLPQPEILQRLQLLCDAVTQEDRQPNEADLKRVRTQILTATGKLRSSLARFPVWRETLRLEPLRQALLRTGEFQSEAITETYQNSLLFSQTPPDGFDAKMIETVRSFSRLLRKYLTLELAVNNEHFSEDYGAFCKGLPAFIETFLSDEHPEYGPVLTDAIAWLSDLDDCAPLAGQIAAFLEEVFGQPNLLIQVSSDFLAYPFQRTIEEPLLVNDRVLRAQVRGNGQTVGETSMEFCPNENRAQIRLLLTTQISSDTVGRSGPIRVFSTNEGSVWGEKMIFLAEDRFQTTAARSSADLTVHTTGIDVAGGCLMREILLKVAENQVPKQKPRYNAESRRIAANRLSNRLNSETDQQIAQLFGRYQEKLRQPLLKTDLFPVPWKFQTTETELKWTTLVAANAQLAAVSNPPELPERSDIVFRTHQSALNNAAQSRLAGRRIEIDEVVSRLKERYPKLAEKLESDDDENPLTAITFAEKSPITCTFKDNLVTIMIHIDRFEQGEQEHPGLDITIKYRVKAETVTENGTTTMNFVFEKAEPPTVFPPGFDPNSGARIAGRNLAIRNIVMKRLDAQLKDAFVVSPMELEEQWKDKGLLTPQTIAADQGWLVVSWLFQ
ncbi:MAG: hypothetical protein FWC43_05175 [Planctomycetaceae bacterium]|nr:hypothetical protein [Planctomycetaceae bacterium]